MSSPSSRPFSPDPSPATDLHAGLGVELDLASERPATASSERERGPGPLVAAIVVCSLALAGVISMVRSDGASTSTVAVPDVAPTVSDRDPSPEPTSQVPSKPVAVPVAKAAVRRGHRRAPTPPPPVAGMRSSTVDAVPAAIASPSSRRSKKNETPVDEHAIGLPAPDFGEPSPVPTDTVVPTALPGVEEPSIFVDDPTDAGTEARHVPQPQSEIGAESEAGAESEVEAGPEPQGVMPSGDPDDDGAVGPEAEVEPVAEAEPAPPAVLDELPPAGSPPPVAPPPSPDVPSPSDPTGRSVAGEPSA